MQHNKNDPVHTPQLHAEKGWKFVDSPSPLWYGLSSQEPGTIPLYGWINDKRDFAWSKKHDWGCDRDYKPVVKLGYPLLYVYVERKDRYVKMYATSDVV